jgi:hypothetical protein
VNAGSANEVAAYASKLAGYSSKASKEVSEMRSRASRRLRPSERAEAGIRAAFARWRLTSAFVGMAMVMTAGRGCSSATTAPVS